MLYTIAVRFSEFYQHCKVLGSEEEKSRIMLIEATKKVMEVCFHLLGMKTVQKL